MSFKSIQELPTPEELSTEFPLAKHLKAKKQLRDNEIADILLGRCDKLLLIIGPCSADQEDSVCTYVSRLARLSESVREKILIVPRIYSSKPRSTGLGYKGILHQPDPLKEPDLLSGILSLRRLHLRILSESGLSGADEMLYPENLDYVKDLISYVTVGTRSVENQLHRFTASGCDLPCGMKNPANGNYTAMLHSVNASRHSQRFIYRGWEVESSGNPLTHSILRGIMSPNGNCIPNYHFEDIMEISHLYQKMKLSNPSVIIDANHCNSGKKYMEQIRICKEIMFNRSQSQPYQKLVKGIMIESYLEDGAQPITGTCYGKSITDPCLGWEKTENLVLRIADLLH